MKVNAALIGYGYWGKIIKRYLDLSGKLKLKYVYFRSANQEGVFVNSIDRILEDDSINVVIIATPIETHYELVKSAILAKKNVMCEKPLVTNKRQAAIIKNMAESYKVKVITDFTYIFSPGIRKIKEVLQRNIIGDIDYMEMRMLQFGSFSADSVFNVLASHLFSILCEWNLIDGMIFEFDFLIKKDGIIETGEVYFKKNNLQGNIFVSLNSPIRERTINIFGSKGFISFNPLREAALQVFLYKNYDSESNGWRNTENYKFDESNTLTNVLDYLHNVLVGLESDNLKMAMKVAEILEKAKESA